MSTPVFGRVSSPDKCLCLVFVPCILDKIFLQFQFCFFFLYNGLLSLGHSFSVARVDAHILGMTNFCKDCKVELEPGVKVECVSKFCYLGDTLGSGGGVVEAARARVRCAWAKFKELSPILTVRGASYRIKGRIYMLVSRVF